MFNFFGKKAEKSEPKRERFSEPTRNTQGDQYSYSPRSPPQPQSILGPPATTASNTQAAKKVRFGDTSVQKPYDLPSPRQTRPVRLSKKERDQVVEKDQVIELLEGLKNHYEREQTEHIRFNQQQRKQQSKLEQQLKLERQQTVEQQQKVQEQQQKLQEQQRELEQQQQQLENLRLQEQQKELEQQQQQLEHLNLSAVVPDPLQSTGAIPKSSRPPIMTNENNSKYAQLVANTTPTDSTGQISAVATLSTAQINTVSGTANSSETAETAETIPSQAVLSQNSESVEPNGATASPVEMTLKEEWMRHKPSKATIKRYAELYTKDQNLTNFDPNQPCMEEAHKMVRSRDYLSTLVKELDDLLNGGQIDRNKANLLLNRVEDQRDR